MARRTDRPAKGEAASSLPADSVIAGLPGLGPKSQQLLARAGIKTIAQLRALGAVAAYVRARDAGGNVSLNLLWALEGALSGLHWQQVAREHRTSLLLALEDHERRH